MKIWVDADACPGGIRDIIIRAAERVQVPTVFVANRFLRLPFSKFISIVQVSQGADVADGYIVQNSNVGDLVVTQDIPLAALIVQKGIIAIDPRGEVHTESTIGQRLSMRDFMDFMRGAGEVTGGPRPFNDKDKQKFAAGFDTVLNRLLRQGS